MREPGSRENPIPRPGSRVLLVDSRERLLLFRIDDPAVDLRSFWITPGGALEPGETFEEAARREVLEETGFADFVLGACVWLRPHLWRWGQRWMASEEQYFLARVDSHEVSLEGQLPHERSVLVEYRWWSLFELEAARDEVFVPRHLATLLAPLLAGDIPATPIEVGE